VFLTIFYGITCIRKGKKVKFGVAKQMKTNGLEILDELKNGVKRWIMFEIFMSSFCVYN
jgi:hypothetical protein